ncbi:MAG: helix-turn-helix transcriptional regulator, partial [Sinomicrobium sp.]|nr:helix-turn-helix transcriptional regulator [Sinomicrobium sp.]
MRLNNGFVFTKITFMTGSKRQQLRTKKDGTALDVSEKEGVSQTVMDRYESKQRRSSETELKKPADALGVTSGDPGAFHVVTWERSLHSACAGSESNNKIRGIAGFNATDFLYSVRSMD